nr:hypothetical protein [Tanacetum cinerariifolium]
MQHMVTIREYSVGEEKIACADDEHITNPTYGEYSVGEEKIACADDEHITNPTYGELLIPDDEELEKSKSEVDKESEQ